MSADFLAANRYLADAAAALQILFDRGRLDDVVWIADDFHHLVTGWSPNRSSPRRRDEGGSTIAR